MNLGQIIGNEFFYWLLKLIKSFIFALFLSYKQPFKKSLKTAINNVC